MPAKGPPDGSRLSADARLILAAQAVRAFAYGLGAVLLGTTLDQRGLSSVEVGVVLAAVVAGTVGTSLLIARHGDTWGRRRCYGALYAALAVVGAVFAVSSTVWLLVLVSLAGALSTDVVESGPFTSLEQAMLATELTGRRRLRGFGTYNAVATGAGSLGALAAGAPGLLRRMWSSAPRDQQWFWLFVPVAVAGVLLTARLSVAVEETDAQARVATGHRGDRARLGPSRPVIVRLAALFAVDSFGGGFVVQSFIAFWLTRRFGASTGTVGAVFFAAGLLQTVAFLAAPRLADRVGLLPTMVFTHLPSNALLVALGFAPNLPSAIALLLARVSLSQMDVPTRQAYVMALVEPREQTAAAAYTNLARYAVRPAGPALAGVAAAGALSAPFAIAGGIKGAYDLVLWSWFRTVRLPEEAADEMGDPSPAQD